MRIPRVRFTVRWLMVTVAAVAIPLAYWCVYEKPRKELLRIAQYHIDELQMRRRGRRRVEPVEAEVDKWHLLMREKYLDASRHPWRSVQPDPPKPDVIEYVYP